MGTNSSHFHPPSSQFHYILNYKYCRVWVRRTDKVEHMEEYRVQINNEKNLDDYKKMFTLRINHNQFISTLYFTHTSGQYLCGNFQQGSILLERVPYRLCQFNFIPYSDIVSILEITLKSFKILSQIYGLFIIKSTMIGFTNNWEIKVWHHTDLSSPLPQNQYCSSERDMVISLIRTVQKLSISQKQQFFSQFLRHRNIKVETFQQAENALYSYLDLHRLYLKKNFNNMIKFLREPPRDINLLEEAQIKQNKSLTKFSFKTGKMMIKNQQKISLNRSSSRQSSVSSVKSQNGLRMFSEAKKFNPIEPVLKKSSKDSISSIIPSFSNSQYFSDLNSGRSLTRNPSQISINNHKKKKDIQLKEKERKYLYSADSFSFVGDERVRAKVTKILQKRNFRKY